MASAIEALGMSVPFSSSNPAKSIDKINECDLIGETLETLIRKNILPSQIVTKKSLENALRLISVLGGSTNAVLHFLAIAKAAKIDLELNDFQSISDKTPFLADLKPSGRYLMKDLHKIGGIPAVLTFMLENDMLHGECLTVTGRTLAENLSETQSLSKGQNLIRPLDILLSHLDISEFSMEI